MCLCLISNKSSWKQQDILFHLKMLILPWCLTLYPQNIANQNFLKPKLQDLKWILNSAINFFSTPIYFGVCMSLCACVCSCTHRAKAIHSENKTKVNFKLHNFVYGITSVQTEPLTSPKSFHIDINSWLNLSPNGFHFIMYLICW